MDDNIEDNSLSTENLLNIFKAMQKIKPIDQSQYFENYMGEIIDRLKHNEILSKEWIETQLSKAIAQKNRGKEPGEPIK
jgi:hypothetical protein